jgi:integrase
MRKAETLKMAQRLEDDHRQIRLGYRPVPKSAEKHRNKPFAVAAAEYVAWGRMQGGRRGGPWGKVHAAKKARHSQFWRETPGFETLGDLDGLLPRVEAILRELNEQGRAGRTIRNTVDAISTFCVWSVTPGYLMENPLADLGRIDTTPLWERRALTLEEIQRLLSVAPEHRRLLYQAAMLSGLRAGELAALTRDHLDAQRCGLNLDAAWTKDRLKGFQPLPERLVKRLVAYADTGVVAQLCRRFFPRFPDAERALLYVPSHPARELDEDLEAAGIPKVTKDGKMDFAALRDSDVTLAAEAGANVKELQTLARHSMPVLTLNVYAKKRDGRLAELAERIGTRVLPEQECVISVHRKPVEAKVFSPKLLSDIHLEQNQENGGGGIRTPVPRCFRVSIYVRSRSICEFRFTQRRATGPAID